MPLPWRVEMLGGLRVVQSDRIVTRFQTQKTGALLAYLALNLSGSHSREFLAELLWPGADPVAVRNRLNQAVSSLRRQLEPPGIVYGSVLVTHQRTIRLNPDSIETDVQEYLRRVQLADTSTDPEEKKTHIKRAIDLYAGPLLEGYYAEWATLEQLRFADVYTSALFDLLDLSRESGDVEQAIRAASLLLKDEPTDEGTHCDLMRLYLDACSRPAAAKRQFEELIRMLAAEGDTPSEEAHDLNREAMAKRPTSAKPMQVQPRDSGATISEEATERPNVLPAAVNRFVGRKPDRQRLRAMLSDEDTRLVTIIGMGGCGKTRLALQLAHDLLSSFDGNVFFVALADIQEAGQIEEALASAMGVREAQNVRRRLVPKTRKTLLGGSTISSISSSRERIRFSPCWKRFLSLKCSRHLSEVPFRVDAERAYTLGPFPSPPNTDEVSELIENPSIALFVDRAQAALPDFQLTSRNAEVVRLVCERLEGWPLAIELAASWAKTVSPSQMLNDMLADRFALLESRRRDISARHRTMRAVLDSGVGLLSADLRELFSRLAVFNGGWTLEAAAFVCRRPDVLYAMESLSEQCLIQTENSNGDRLRFRMLDTVRDYAMEHLPAADLAETANLHAEFFSKLADEGTVDLFLHGSCRMGGAIVRPRSQIYPPHFAGRSRSRLSRIQALILANSLTPFWEFKGANPRRASMDRSLASRVCRQRSRLIRGSRREALTNLARLTWLHRRSSNRRSDGTVNVWRPGWLWEIRKGSSPPNLTFRSKPIGRGTTPDRSRFLKTTFAAPKLLPIEPSSRGAGWRLATHPSKCVGSMTPANNMGEGFFSWPGDVDAANKQRIAAALNNLGNLAVLGGQLQLARHYLLQALAGFEEAGTTPNSTDTLIHLAKLERHEGESAAALRWIHQAWSQHPEESYHVQSVFLEQAFAAASARKFALAATFLGFVDRLREDSGALNVDIEQEEADSLVESVKSALGDTAYNESWSLGRTLDRPQAAQRMLKA